MTELKTLKDLYENTTDKEIVMVEELKAEAVKWVKDIELKEFPTLKEEWAVGAKNWIKHFFNLTESDLEEKK